MGAGGTVEERHGYVLYKGVASLARDVEASALQSTSFSSKRSQESRFFFK